MKYLIGKTYSIKDKIKEAGGKWVSGVCGEGWMVPDDKFDELQQLLGPCKELGFSIEDRHNGKKRKTTIYTDGALYYRDIRNFYADGTEWNSELSTVNRGTAASLCENLTECEIDNIFYAKQ